METKVHFRRLDAALLPAFRSYLLHEAAEGIASGREDIIAVGAVTEDRHSCGAAACVTGGEEGPALFSLYVDPQVRRQGIGRRLLEALEREAGARMVSAHWLLPEEGAAEVDVFLHACGFSPAEIDPLGIMRLNTADMRELPAVRRALSAGFRADGNIRQLMEFTEAEREELFSDRSIDARLHPANFTKAQLESALSLGYRYGGRIAAYIIAEPVEEGIVVLSAVTRSGGHPAAFHQLAAAVLHRGMEYFPGRDYSCWLEAISEPAERMAQYYCRGKYEIWHECHAVRREAPQ